MNKKALIIVNLQADVCKSTIIQIKEKIRNEATIPWCKDIEKVVIEDIDTTYKNLKKQGLSSNIARTIVKLYTE